MSAGRIQYNSINVDFDNPFNKFDIVKRNIQTINKSLSGLSKTVSFYDSDLITVGRNWLTGSEIEQLESWWRYVKDGSTFSVWRDKDILIYAPFEHNVYNVANNVNGVFTRTGNANYLDRSTGLWTQKTQDESRHPAGKFGDCVLIENSTTNYISDVDDFSAVSWSTINLTVTANQGLAPDGTLTADLLYATSSGASVYQDTGVNISSDSASFGVWLKAVGETVQAVIYIEPDTGGTTYASSVVDVTPEWQYFACSWKNTGSVAADWLVRISVGTGERIVAWRANLQINYWPTSSTITTRSNDKLYFDIPSWFNQVSFSVSFWVKFPWDEVLGIVRRFLNFTYNTTSVIGFKLDSINELSFNWPNITSTDSIVLTVSGAPYGLTPGEWYHFGLVIDSLNADYRIYINGEEQTVNSDDELAPYNVNRLYVGSTVTPSEYTDSYYDDLFMTQEVLTANHMKNIYTANRALGVIRNYYSTVRLLNAEYFPVKRVGTDRWDFEAEFEEVPT